MKLSWASLHYSTWRARDLSHHSPTSCSSNSELNMARHNFKFSLLFWTLFLILLLQNSCLGKEKKPDPKKKKEKSSKIGKNILDYNEADLYKLLDQWEVSKALAANVQIYIGFFLFCTSKNKNRKSICQQVSHSPCMVN